MSPTLITILLIVVSAIITTLLTIFKKDKCLKDFQGYNVTLIETDEEVFTGKFNLETTGFELFYKKENEKKELSYILYKTEFGNIKLIARFVNNLSEKGKKKRNRSLKKSYYPSFLRKSFRKTINLCKTFKDSIIQIANILINQIKKKNQNNEILKQDSQINKIKSDAFGFIGPPSFDPILENHIGEKVICEITLNDKVHKYIGELKEYTSDFFELINVNYEIGEYEEITQTDLIVPRKISIIKHSAEILA